MRWDNAYWYLVWILMAACLPTTSVSGEDWTLFVSSFARGDKGAIHALGLNSAGELKRLSSTKDDLEQPFFIALTRDRKFLYSIHAPQGFGGKEEEQVAAYRIADRQGTLELINRQSARGSAACYLDVDRTGKSVLVANYTSGSVASLPIQKDGSLGESQSFVQHEGSSVNPKRQKEPHAHCFVISPDNQFAFAADLGIDQVRGYRLDAATAKLKPASFAATPPGAGPRHLTFAPNGKQMYVINELSNSVTRFAYDAKSGGLERKQTISTLPEDFDGTSYCADLKITPDGKFLFGTNRGHDSLASYRIGEDGDLELLKIQPSLGKGPQNLAITPDGKLLLCANMPGNNLAVFRIDAASGELTPVGEPLEITSPSCIRIK